MATGNQEKKELKRKFALECRPTQARITLVKKKKKLIVCGEISKFKAVGEKHVQFKDDEKVINCTFPNNSSLKLFEQLFHYCKDHSRKNTAPPQLAIFIGSWNVGNAPPPDNLSAWMDNNNNCDVYVFGAQECTYKERKGYESCDADWFSHVTQMLGPEYTMIEKASMWQIRLGVFVKTSLTTFIYDISKTKEATGIANVAGNKGAVGISFMYQGRSFCFVNSHLAAHQDLVSDRNYDVKEIIRGLKLGENNDVTSFDYLFWNGDLNYRIDLTRPDVLEATKNWNHTNLERLYRYDQLNTQRAKGHVFFDFNEGAIKFPPTYKYDPGQPHVEYSAERNRVPAWCDRILWTTTAPNSTLQPTAYAAVNSIITSDHVPIYGIFNVPTPNPFDNFGHAGIPPTRCLIALYDIFARGLIAADANNKSDPYIKFHSPFIESIKTSVVNETLNPNFPDFLVLQPNVTFLPVLTTSTIYVTVLDRDVGSPKDDMIGKGTFALKSLSSATQHTNVRVTLRRHGHPAGYLFFKMALVVNDALGKSQH